MLQQDANFGASFPVQVDAEIVAKGQSGAFVADIIATAGAPTTGTWQTGQSVIDANGIVWNCTAGGTPGIWTQVTPNTELGYFSSTATVTNLTSTTFAAITGYSKTVTVPNTGRPVYVDCTIGLLQVNSAGANLVLDIYEDGASTTGGSGCFDFTVPSATGIYSAMFRVRRTPAPGSHTYSVWYKTSAGTFAIAAFGEPYDMAITQG